jgi:hypothetical protein
MGGTTAEYSEAMLRAAVEAYDPALHAAPIVVGHPADNHPAYGWIGKLTLDDGHVVAEPSDVNPDFAELVQKRAYRTRSASWYLPDAPSNPKPGSLYLRHVGFLGATPPAIKGLRDVSFGASTEGVVEFGSQEAGLLATIFQGLREWFIEAHGLEKADQVVPKWATQEAEALARQPPPEPPPAFAEPEPPQNDKEPAVTAEQIAATEAENTRLKAELETARASAKQVADFAEREAELARRATEIAIKEIATTVDGLIAAGKVLPATKAQLVAFAASLTDDGECLEFSEGEGKSKKLSQRASYLALLEQGPKLVEFAEIARDERQGDKPKLSEAQIGDKAASYAEEQRKKGIVVSATEAVAYITAEAGV